MPVQFCTDCGDLLPISKRLQVVCECCSRTNPNKLLNSVTISSTNDFPSELRDRRGVVKKAKQIAPVDTWSTIDVKCPQCNANEVQYTALQLKSADEGTTIFYSCSNCSARWNEDN